MDYNGNDVSSGGGGINPGENACFGNLTGEKISVGDCSTTLYSLPVAQKANEYDSGIIISKGGEIEISGTNADFVFSIVPQSISITSVSIPVGTYALTDLINIIETTINAEWQSLGSTNTFNITIKSGGKLNVGMSAGGNSTSTNIPQLFGWVLLGNSAGSSTILAGNSYTFLNLPTYSNTEHSTTWANYNFNEAGNLFNGNMTVTGSLTTSQLITDLDVEDSQITLNKNAPNNDNASGLVLNSNANINFSGLIKQSNTNDFYLFADSAIPPTETGWIAESTGNLSLNDFEAVGEVTIGSGATNYVLPTTRGTDGQSLVFTDNIGNSEFIFLNRITDGINDSYMESDSGSGSIVVDGNNRFVASNLTTTMYSVDNLTTLQLTNNGITIDANGNNILQSTSAFTLLNSQINPSGTFLRVGEGIIGTKLQFNGLPRVIVNTTSSLLQSPDITSRFIVTDGYDKIIYNNVDRLTIDPTITELTFSPTSRLFMSEVSHFQEVNDIVRFSISEVETYMRSKNTNYLIGAQDTQIALTANGTDAVLIDSTSISLNSPNETKQLLITDTDLTYSDGVNAKLNIQTDTTTISNFLECEDELRVNGKITLIDNNALQLGSTSSTATVKPITMLFVANAAIAVGRAIKIVNVGGVGRVQVVAATDPDSTGVVGVSYTASGAAGQTIEVAIGGSFECCVIDTLTVNAGDLIEKSDSAVGTNEGRVGSAPASAGTFGIALSSGTGDTAGTVFIRAIFMKNEVF